MAKKKFVIVIEHHPELPPDQAYLGYIKGEEYKGYVDSGKSYGDVIQELGIGIDFLDDYRNNPDKYSLSPSKGGEELKKIK